MLVSTKLRFVFVHVQKTGGVSVEKALRALDPDARVELAPGKLGRHAPAREIRETMTPDEWQASYRFGFVRNPFSRLVSWYHHCVQKPTNRFHEDVREKCPTFRDFILRRDFFGWRRTERNQAGYFSDECGIRIVDFVGRFELLGDDFAEIHRQIRARHADPTSLPTEHGLPHVNRTTHAGHRQYFDDETRAVVEQRFARDLETFDYSF